MTRRKFEFTSEQPDDVTIIFTLNGFLSGSTHGYDFQKDIRDCIGRGVRRVVIDLAGVDKVDSSGIGILASATWTASQAGGRMVLASLPPHVEKVLKMALLLDHIHHANSREAALALLDRP